MEVTYVATSYIEEGLRMTDIHPINELPTELEKIEQDGSQLVGVRQFEESPCAAASS